MRYLIVVALLALMAVPSFAADDSASVSLSIDAVCEVTVAATALAFTAGNGNDPGDDGDFTVGTAITAKSNQTWALALKVEDNCTTPHTSNLGHTNETDHLPCVASHDMACGGSGGPGLDASGTLTVTVTRDGLNDRAGAYSGTVTATLTCS